MMETNVVEVAIGSTRVLVIVLRDAQVGRHISAYIEPQAAESVRN